MTALPLNPYDNNYLSCRLINEQLTDNKLDVTLAENVIAASAEQTPKLVLDGTGRASLIGAVSIDTSSTSAYFPLLSLPAKINPTKDFSFPVYVNGASAYVPNAVTVQKKGSGIIAISVDAPGSYSTRPTFSVIGDGVGAALDALMGALTATPVTAQSGAGSYAPNDTITLAGGSPSPAAVLKVTHTKVESATVAAAGAGGTPGTQTVTGTTGTGTKFQATVTVSGGGAITSVDSISVAGDYTVNPTSLTNEPVTGGGLTGAQLSLKMGVLTAAVDTTGTYTTLPSNPAAQASTSGAGTGATFTMTWKIVGGEVTSAGKGYSEGNTTIEISGSGGGIVTPVFSEEEPAQVVLIGTPNENDMVSLDGINFLVEPYF
jgi:hypothetical protein